MTRIQKEATLEWLKEKQRLLESWPMFAEYYQVPLLELIQWVNDHKPSD